MSLLLVSLLTAGPLVDPDFLREFTETRHYRSGRPTQARATADGKTVFFLRSGARDAKQTLFEFDVATGTTKELLTPDTLLNGAAQTFSVEEKAHMERMRVTTRGFTSYKLTRDGTKLLVGLSGHLYLYTRADGKVAQLKTGDGVLDPQLSPDGTRVAYVRSNDVYVLELAKNVEQRVTTGGTAEVPHGLAEFVAQEEMDRFSGFWWSPDSAFIVYQDTNHAGVEQLSIVDPLHPEREADRFYYPRPGKKNAVVKLGLVPASGGKTTWLTWDAAAFPYVATVDWARVEPKAPSSSLNGPLTVLVQNREQTKEQLMLVDVKTGKTTVLLTEADSAWLNLEQSFPRWKKDGTGFFWASERSGGTEIELRNADGSLNAVWVKKDAGFSMFVGYDDSHASLYFTGSADPTLAELSRVTAQGPVERVPTQAKGPGLEFATLSPGGDLLIVSTTSLGTLSVTHVQRSDGTLVAQLPSVALNPTLALNAKFLTLPGDTAFRAVVVKPKDFVRGQKYPVILDVYGGPGHQKVMQSAGALLELQWLANQGFIVVTLDGHGTPRRGRDFERSIKGDFATQIANDQVTGLTQLAKEVPEIDLGRVGVTGWSFGGYLAALLTMTKGEVFKFGVAGAPVVDWRDYDTHYTERYLGVPSTPDDKAYQVSSLLTHVAETKRPLLVIHGTSDDNVYFLHSLKLSDALFRAGKPHSVLPLTNFTHLVVDPVVAERLNEVIVTAFKDHL